MRYTLLELVQDVLSSMDSDEVNGINDTVESQQVVKVIKSVYDDLVSRGELSQHKTLFNLTSSTTTTKPVLMTKPATIDRIDWVKYNKILDGGETPVWDELRYLPVVDFINYIQQYNESEDNVETFEHTVDGFTFTFIYKNDTGPCYYTSFNDNTIIFDAYDTEVDTTLQTSKTLCYGNKRIDFVESNLFVPDLQPHQFALLLNEAKSLAWVELKQMPHQKAERTARRNWINLSKTRQNIPSGEFRSNSHPFDKLPNFSRK